MSIALLLKSNQFSHGSKYKSIDMKLNMLENKNWRIS